MSKPQTATPITETVYTRAPYWQEVPDERLGQVGKAFVVRKRHSEVGADELIAWSRDRMAGFKVPRSVEFLDALPLNATGKVMKDQLR